MQNNNDPSISGRVLEARKCSECGELFATYRPHKKTCSKECSGLRSRRVAREYYHDNPERKRKVKERRQTPESREYDRGYYKRNSEKIREQVAEWRKKHPEKLASYAKRRKERNARKSQGLQHTMER